MTAWHGSVVGNAGQMQAEETFYEPLGVERIVWDRPLATAVAAELERRRAQRPIVVVSPGCRRAGAVAPMLQAMPQAVIFDAIASHVSRTAVIALVTAIRAAAADIVVTIGGGSTIDTVKVALAGLAADIASADEIDGLAITVDGDGVRHVPRLPVPPIRQICAPTTLSGAEFSDLAGCVDPATGVKQLFTGPGIGSATVILDPAVTLSTPREIWLSSGIRAIDHAVESLCSVASNPFVDATSLAAVTRLATALRRTHADPRDAASRLDAQLGVWLACTGLNRVPWGASHGLGHQLGAVAGIPHGYCSCILLPHVLAFNRAYGSMPQSRVAAALGAPASNAADAVGALVAALGLPRRLRDVGVERAMLDTIARTSMGNMFVRQNPRPVRSPDDLLQILQAAW